MMMQFGTSNILSDDLTYPEVLKGTLNCLGGLFEVAERVDSDMVEEQNAILPSN